MATRIPEETIDQIRTETNIVDVVSQYVQLKKRGKNYFGFCPFHDERTPSFSVTEEKQIFHCFSCGQGGNVFRFLMEVEGLDFVESVKRAAELSDLQVDIAIDNQPKTAVQNKKEQLIAIHEAASAYYHQILMNTVTGEKALEYLLERGFTTELLEEFQIGFSPPNKTTTYQILKRDRHSDDLLRESGIFSERSDSAELLDRFGSRIIFPLRNEKGKVVAFSGRILPGEDDFNDQSFHEAKYLNSPETAIFSKRYFLFNLDKARSQMRKTSEVVLFEGYMDVISAWQAGVTNGVASMGTALTEEQIRILNKIVDSVTIAYDGDRAGMEATNKAIEGLAQGNRFELAIIPLPKGMDPDDVIRQKGAQAFRDIINNQKETVFQFQSRFLKTKLNLDTEANRLQYLEEVLKRLVHVDSIIEREMHLTDLASEFKLDLAVLKKQLQDYQTGYLNQQKDQPKKQTQDRRAPISTESMSVKQKLTPLQISERQLMYRLFHYEEAWHYLKELTTDFNFVSESLQTIYLLYDAFYQESGQVGQIDRFLDRIKDQHLVTAIIEIEMIDLQSDVSSQEISDIVTIICSKSPLETQLEQKKRAMAEATRQQDKDQAMRLLEDIVNLTRELKLVKK